MNKQVNDTWMVCEECGRKYLLSVPTDRVPGGKLEEEYYCPYCGHKEGSVMTSEFPITFKEEEIEEE